jgi:hypothetical protein
MNDSLFTRKIAACAQGAGYFTVVVSGLRLTTDNYEVFGRMTLADAPVNLRSYSEI